MAIGFVVLPVAVVCGPVYVEELALAVGLVQFPFSFVLGLVTPSHRALTVAQTTPPLTLVNSPSLVVFHVMGEGGIGAVESKQGFLAFSPVKVLGF